MRFQEARQVFEGFQFGQFCGFFPFSVFCSELYELRKLLQVFHVDIRRILGQNFPATLGYAEVAAPR
jgi:uncharacterized membrane protein